jgi:mono/diheme cytochrome c family protein
LAYTYANQRAGREYEQRKEQLAKSAGESAPPAGPLRLQADTSKVRFANLWVRPLADVDHETMITSLGQRNFDAGREIYDSICITCHGNLTQEGSIPTSRKFWEAEFKNGNDPYSMYRTLGDGFGQMPQFPFLSPQQRYDVIHYVMEGLVKPNNPDQYFKVDQTYLASLPKGIGEGELTDAMKEYAKGPQYLRMNFGPALNWTYQVDEGNIAYKGIAVRLDDGPGGVSKGRAWMLYDHDTMRVATAWTGSEFVDWRGIAFDGSHGTHTSIKGQRVFVNPVGPGWARPGTDDWSDPRFRGRDDKPYGPLPREWTHYKGHYLFGNRMVLHYTVGDANVLESPGLESMSGADVFTRTLNIGKSTSDLMLRVAPDGAAVAIAGASPLSIESKGGFQILQIPSSATPVDLKLLVASGGSEALNTFAGSSPSAELLEPYTKGGPPSWNQSVTTKGELAENNSAYVVDTIKAPHNDANPWNSWMRLGGFDFHPNGNTAIVCTWMGDVWRVDGINSDLAELTWTRIASGLFQPLGVIVRDNVIYVTCRDQLAELHDLNGDGEIDWYRSFNNDHQVTEHFHEFAMGLQQDGDGNFYYAKSARHAKTALVEHWSLHQSGRFILRYRSGRALDAEESHQLGEARWVLREHDGLSQSHQHGG